MKSENIQPTLPGFESIIKTDEMKATEYITNLQNNGFISKNRIYLANYINSDLAIALSHIRKAYMSYVIKGNWSEEKFNTVVTSIIDDNWMLIPSNFSKKGILFDEGNLTIEEDIEEFTDEEMKAALAEQWNWGEDNE